MNQVNDTERLRRWRMVLGGVDDGTGARLGGDDVRIDAALAAVYDHPPANRSGSRRQGGLGASAPVVNRWLGDIRRYFPASVVHVLQRDAIDRFGLKRLLLEPETLASLEPDIHLVATLLELKHLIPETARATARQVVGQVTREVESRIADHTRQAVSGALSRARRVRRPRPADVDWNRTIHANLKHYQPEYRTIVPERLIGYGRRQAMVEREIVLAIDQSGSMTSSVVYAGVYGSVLASIRTLKTSVVAFDTAVADLTDRLDDPVDVLFGVQMGGGTDIAGAVAYCDRLIQRPSQSVLILLTDLHEGGLRDELPRRIAAMTRRGVTCVVLLALSDDGAPSYDRAQAAALAELGVAAFACTPDRFPDLLAAAIEGRDLAGWAGSNGLVAASPILDPI